ncbi:MAG: hypothetical protein HOQ03_12150, partial [Thermoleophilia bacterium]|nr:hypothetical protein [Thermoleophilia bacterium]
GGLPLALLFPSRDAEALAARIRELAEAPAATRREVGAELRRRVVDGHSVESWADAVVESLTGQGPE